MKTPICIFYSDEVYLGVSIYSREKPISKLDLNVTLF
jgi:hypothetical protein